MAARHRSRERALQLLFAVDMRKQAAEDAIQAFYDSLYSDDADEPRPEPDLFMERLVRDTAAQRAGIDERIAKYSEHWRVERMSVVDRNILRMAACEMLAGLTPAAVVIDEALELARRFSGEESVPFINGVLDAVLKGGAVEGREGQ